VGLEIGDIQLSLSFFAAFPVKLGVHFFPQTRHMTAGSGWGFPKKKAT
jgi:hypothetical protein